MYSTESNKPLVGFNVAASELKLNSSKEIGTVLADPLGYEAGTTSIEPNCTVSENVNVSVQVNDRFPDVETHAAMRDGLYVETVGAAWSITANS